MRIFILRSQRHPRGQAGGDDYAQHFTSNYAEKVIGNLVGEEGFCAACGGDCNACRRPYKRRFGQHIVGVVAFPPVLPYLLEEPASHVPTDVPAHDVLLAVNIHEQILVEMLKRCRAWGTRAAVVPVESPGWVSSAARAEAEAVCTRLGVEVAFPRPFCAFDPPAGSTLAEFRRHFCIGKPDVELTVVGGVIERAHVKVSAACGATYYVARWLVGRRVDDDLKFDVVAKRMHSYPCTASMEWDDEAGDTLLHVAGQAHYEILAPLTGDVREDSPMVMSPLGRMLPKPVPARENVRNIERAKRAILADLGAGVPVTLAGLRAKPDLTPAAVYSALLLLEREGRIRRQGRRIVEA